MRIAFITAFRYRQTAEDEWQGGVLVRTRVLTNDDGEKSLVHAEAVDGKLAVKGPDNDYKVDLGVMHDLSLWNEAVTRQTRLIDATDGDLTKVTIRPSVDDAVELGGQRVPARRFEIIASAKRSGLVWYDENGAWVKARLKTRGEVLEYELAV